MTNIQEYVNTLTHLNNWPSVNAQYINNNLELYIGDDVIRLHDVKRTKNEFVMNLVRQVLHEHFTEQL